MANPKLLGVDLSVFAFTWSEGANASYPVTNLLNGYSDIYSQAANTDADQYVVIDRGSALPADTLIVDGHNWHDIADIALRLQYNTPDDGTWGTPTSINANINPADNNAFAVEFGSVSKRYVRVLFNSAAPLTAAPKAGNIFLGTRVEFETTQMPGYYTNVPANIVTRSRATDGRLRVAENYAPIRRHKISFTEGNMQSDALITSYIAFLDAIGGKPFYYVDHKGAIYLVVFGKDFNPYNAEMFNQNKIPDLEMESVMPG